MNAKPLKESELRHVCAEEAFEAGQKAPPLQ